MSIRQLQCPSCKKYAEHTVRNKATSTCRFCGKTAVQTVIVDCMSGKTCVWLEV